MRTPEPQNWHVQVVNWVLTFLIGLRRSQRKTLGELVYGAMRCRRVSEADIGRAMETGTVPKHNIKRVWRFLRNQRVEVTEGMRAVACLAARAARGRLVVAIDWVDVGRYKVLRAAVPLRGRSVPIAFAAYHPNALFKSQNALEEGFLVLLRSLVPSRTEIIVVADRGFARAELARHLDQIGVKYVIRVGRKVHFDCAQYRGLLEDLPICPCEHLDLGVGWYREEVPVRRRLVAYWQRGQLEALLLATNMTWVWRRIVKTFQLRMMIEELFRDEKNIRYGWGLRQFVATSPARLERLFLVLILAYLLLLLFGLRCLEAFSSAHWAASSSKKRRQTSAFVVARLMLPRHAVSITLLLRLLVRLLGNPSIRNWG
jgi:hypothetical protein